MSEGNSRSAKGANRVLFLLLAAYILNFLDRQILGILAQPIKADLQLTDTQFGAIGGLAFAILYALLGLPLGYIADRTSRGGVIAAALAVWSGFTALCGTATGFAQLFVYRLGVGVGEAGGVAPSYALIAERFAPERRARALAVFSLGVPIGLALGTLIGAYIARAIDWRAAFLVMGAAGILFAPLLWLGTRGGERAPRSPSPRAMYAGFAAVAAKPSFWLLSLAAGMSSLSGYGLALWMPSVIMRSFGLDLTATANFLASILLIGGPIGMLTGGALADRLRRRDRRWSCWLPACAWLLTVPLYAMGLMAGQLSIAWPLLLVANGLNILWFGPLIAAVQQLSPPRYRATASGAYLLIVNLVGLGVGPLLMGWISDLLRPSYGDGSLRMAALFCLAFYGLASLLALAAAHFLRSDWVEEGAGPAL